MQHFRPVCALRRTSFDHSATLHVPLALNPAGCLHRCEPVCQRVDGPGQGDAVVVTETPMLVEGTAGSHSNSSPTSDRRWPSATELGALAIMVTGGLLVCV